MSVRLHQICSFLQATPAMTKSTRKAGIIVEKFTVCLDFEHEFCDSKGVYNNSALTSVECITPAFLGGQLCILGGKVLGVRGPLIVDSCCLNACLVALYFML